MENNNINVEQNSVQENNMNQTQQKPKKKNLAVRIGLGMVAIGLSYLAGYYLGDKIRDHKDNETNTTSAISNKTSNVESNVTSNVESNATSNVTSDVNTNTTNTMSNEHAIALAKTLYEQAEYATFDFLVMDSCKQVKDNTYDCTNQFNNLKKLFSTNGKIGDETTKEFIFNSYKVVKEDDIVKYLRELGGTGFDTQVVSTDFKVKSIEANKISYTVTALVQSVGSNKSTDISDFVIVLEDGYWKIQNFKFIG